MEKQVNAQWLATDGDALSPDSALHRQGHKLIRATVVKPLTAKLHVRSARVHVGKISHDEFPSRRKDWAM